MIDRIADSVRPLEGRAPNSSRRMPKMMRRTRGFRVRLWVCGLAMLLAAASAWATEYHGQVFVQGVPVPGATVTVAQDGQHFSTVTDEQGVYAFPDLKDGEWKIEIRMRGFATLKSQVTVGPNLPQGKFELTMLGLEQMLEQAKVTTPEAPPNPQLATRAEEKSKPAETVAAMPPPRTRPTSRRRMGS